MDLSFYGIIFKLKSPRTGRWMYAFPRSGPCYEYVSCHMEMVFTNLCYKYYIILYFLLALFYGAQYYHILQREKHNNQSKFNLDTQFEKYEVSFKLY